MKRGTKVWFENSAGIISHGEIVWGAPGSHNNNLVYCERTKKWLEDVPTWQTLAQYEKLKRGDKRGPFLNRNRGGSIHCPGDLRRLRAA
jgi:hypothetical protein